MLRHIFLKGELSKLPIMFIMDKLVIAIMRILFYQGGCCNASKSIMG